MGSKLETEQKRVTCIDCDNRLSVNGEFYIMGWVRPGPDITLDDELEYNEDFGPYCNTCFKYRKEQLKQPSSVIKK